MYNKSQYFVISNENLGIFSASQLNCMFALDVLLVPITSLQMELDGVVLWLYGDQ
jgi:hypothetical protein